MSAIGRDEVTGFFDRYRADNQLLQIFRTGYQLIRGAQGPRVRMCIAHDEDLSAMQSAPR